MRFNKKADVAITILVLGVIALCILALLSFYMADKNRKSEGINSVFHLQKVYNLAESVKFSGQNLVNNYVHAKHNGANFVIEKGILNKNQEISLKINYVFSP